MKRNATLRSKKTWSVPISDPDVQFAYPYDVETVYGTMKELKKVDTFYKDHAKALAPSLASLAFAIAKSRKFPTECKIGKMTFLKNRTIFSGDFVTKFFESLFLKGLKEVLPPETLGQFAYQPGRSTVLCCLIGLNEVEKENDLVFGWSADQVKAFDSTNHTTVAQIFQNRS